MIRVRLYNNPSDYETRYVAEVEAPQSRCGGLNLHDLPNLFQTNGTFDVSCCSLHSTWLIEALHLRLLRADATNL